MYQVQELTRKAAYCSNDVRHEVTNKQTVLYLWHALQERYECSLSKSEQTYFLRPIACSPDPWVSRCGVCLRLQGITSALNHVAPCLECAQCNHPAIFLTHKLSEGLTQRLDTRCRSLEQIVSELQSGPSQANSAAVVWCSFLSQWQARTRARNFDHFFCFLCFIRQTINTKSWNSVNTSTRLCTRCECELFLYPEV